MPWKSLPNPLAPDFVQTYLNFGCLIRCRYSSFRPVSSSRTELAYILYSCEIKSLRWYHVDWRCLAAFAKPPPLYMALVVARCGDFCVFPIGALSSMHVRFAGTSLMKSQLGPLYILLLLRGTVLLHPHPLIEDLYNFSRASCWKILPL